MIFDVEPIADLLAVAVNGERFSLQGIEHDQRDELFRKLIGAIIVRTIGGYHRHPVCVEIGPNEEIARSFGSGVGAVGRVGCRLAKSWVVSCQSPIYFVGRNVKKSKGFLSSAVQGDPTLFGCLEQP